MAEELDFICKAAYDLRKLSQVKTPIIDVTLEGYVFDVTFHKLDAWNNHKLFATSFEYRGIKFIKGDYQK